MVDDIGLDTDKNIADAIRQCCIDADYTPTRRIAFRFGKFGNGSIITSRAFPSPLLSINKPLWQKLTLAERSESLRSEVCYILACMWRGKLVKPHGEEWRLFALKVNLLEVQADSPMGVFTLLDASSW